MSLKETCLRIRVGAVLIENNRMLLIAHKKDGEVYWMLPGGGVNVGESLEDALKRELLEELNISVKVNAVSFLSDSIHPFGKRHIVNICFLCSHLSGEYKLGVEERLHGFNFFTVKELESLRIYPPVNNELIAILNGKQSAAYLGKLWMVQ